MYEEEEEKFFELVDSYIPQAYFMPYGSVEERYEAAAREAAEQVPQSGKVGDAVHE